MYIQALMVLWIFIFLYLVYMSEIENKIHNRSFSILACTFFIVSFVSTPYFKKQIESFSISFESSKDEYSVGSKQKGKKVFSREDQMYKCYENCTDTRDRCLSEGTYRPAVCYDNYDTCADIVCCSQYKDINPLCR